MSVATGLAVTKTLAGTVLLIGAELGTPAVERAAERAALDGGEALDEDGAAAGAVPFVDDEAFVA